MTDESETGNPTGGLDMVAVELTVETACMCGTPREVSPPRRLGFRQEITVVDSALWFLRSFTPQYVTHAAYDGYAAALLKRRLSPCYPPLGRAPSDAPNALANLYGTAPAHETERRARRIES
eukprot:698132-Pyramimonas_sp.AAC.1